MLKRVKDVPMASTFWKRSVPSRDKGVVCVALGWLAPKGTAAQGAAQCDALGQATGANCHQQPCHGSCQQLVFVNAL